MTTVLHIDNLHKSFGDHKVLNGVNLAVKKGTCVAIIGASGTGKSVLLKCILGLLPIDQGTITLQGASITAKSRRLRGAHQKNALQKVGMLFQNAALFDSLKLWENVAFAARNSFGMGRNKAKDLAMKTLHKTGIDTATAACFPAQVSMGVRKRTGLARAIILRPDVIFFDEPTTGLDPIMTGVINHLIKQQINDIQSTALTITHDMASTRVIADYVIMLHQGKIVWQGSCSAMEKSDNPYITQFIHGRDEGPITTESTP